MSRQFRHRVAAIVLGGFFVGVPLLANGTASAQQLGVGGRQVTFEGGGILAFSCESRPDADTMTVPIDLLSRPVPTVEPHRPGGPKPSPTSASSLTRPDAGLPVLPAPDGVLPAQPDGALPVRPHRATPSVGHPPAKHPSVARPPAKHRSLHRPRTNRSTSGQSPAKHRSVRHTRAGVPHATATSGRTSRPHHAVTRPKTNIKTPVGTAAGAPSLGGRAGGSGVPQVDVTPMAAGAGPASRLAASQSLAASRSAAAEPVTAMRPLPVANRVGLLGVIAAVCAIGVTAAAIRSIVSQRANRRIMT